MPLEIKERNHDFFKDIDKNTVILILARLEQNNNLLVFMTDNAPDYVLGNEVQKFTLLMDLKIL